MSTHWRQQAWAALIVLHESDADFTCDDVTDQVGTPDNSHQANGRNSAVGSLFREAHQAGLIEPVGTARSKAPHRKGGLIQVWHGVKKPTLFDDGVA